MELLIFLVSISYLAVILLIVFVFSYMQKKKIQFILERERAKANSEEQLLKTEVEITDQNLKNISWELHDNVGQLLSVASMEAKMLKNQEDLKGVLKL